MKKKFLLYMFFVFSLSSCQPEDVNANDPEDSLSGINKELMLQLVNSYRESGCDCGGEYMAPTAPVSWSTKLEMAAWKHSQDMNDNDFFSHTGSDGSSPGERISLEGYSWRNCAENISMGRSNEKDVIEGWINSPGHCKNIMNPALKEMGGAKSGVYWTLVLGAQ